MDMPTGPAPIEPSADQRAMALNLRQMHLALVAEGFTEPQAIRLLGVCIAASFGKS